MSGRPARRGDVMPEENPGLLPTPLTAGEAAAWIAEFNECYALSADLSNGLSDACRRAMSEHCQRIADYLRDRGFRWRGGSDFRAVDPPGMPGGRGGRPYAPYVQDPPGQRPALTPPRPGGSAPARPRPPARPGCTDPPVCPPGSRNTGTGGPALGGLPFVIGEDLYNRYAGDLGLPQPLPLEQQFIQYIQNNPGIAPLLGVPGTPPLGGAFPRPGTAFNPTGPTVTPGTVTPLVPGACPSPFRDPSDPFGRNPFGRGGSGFGRGPSPRGATQGQQASPFVPSGGPPTGPVTNPASPQPPSWTRFPPSPPYPLIITPDNPGWIEVGPPWNNPGPIPGNPCDWGGPCMPDPPPLPPQPQPTVTSLVPVDASGCGLPTPAVARTYTVAVSGVTNHQCPNCNGFNTTWGVSFGSHDRGSGFSACGWDSLDPPGLCTPVGPYGNVELRYSTGGAAYQLVFKGLGGSNEASYGCAAASFNGLGSSLFSRQTPDNAAGCDGWPASLTVSAA